MAVLRKILNLQPDEDRLLRFLYLARKIPSDQYTRRPQDLRAFVATWNRLAGRTDSDGELLHYVKTKRKNGEWVTFNGSHLRQPLVSLPEMTTDEWTVFDEVYKQINVASDNYVYNSTNGQHFAAAFAGRTGRRLSEHDVMILMIDRRKEGLLPTLEQQGPDDVGFRDLDDASNM